MDDGLAGLRGFAPADALWRLLRLKGRVGDLQAFRDGYDGDETSGSLVEALGAEGVQARAAVVAGDELGSLELPTLARLDGGAWLLLRGNRGGEIDVEGQGWRGRVPAAVLAARLGGEVLDLSAELEPGRGLWGALGRVLLHHRATLLQVAAATVAYQLLGLALPELAGLALGRALPDGARSTLRLLAAGMVAAALFRAWVGWLRERMLLYLVTRLEVSAQRGLLHHLLRLPFPILQRLTYAELAQSVLGLAAARETLGERVLGAALDGALAAAYLLAMAVKLPAATGAVVLVSLAAGLLTLLVGRAQARWQGREVEARTRQRGYLIELLRGIATVKASGAEQKGLERWLRRFAEEVRTALERQRLGLWAEVGLDLLPQGIQVALLVWGGHTVLRGELALGKLFAFLLLAAGFLAAARGLAQAYLALANLRPQLARSAELLAIAQEPRPTRSRAPASPAAVVMDDVWFRYGPDRPWILEGYHLRLEPGSKHALTGASGSGKSTILRLLSGLYQPERGAISIGGLPPQAAREHLIYLPQFVRLFGGSIRENLRVLSGGVPEAVLLEAARRTGLHALLASLPMGYGTILPPGGTTLSGGQRQLIALTAALASGRRLLLLDEATANVDAIGAAALADIIAGLPQTVVSARHVA